MSGRERVDAKVGLLSSIWLLQDRFVDRLDPEPVRPSLDNFFGELSSTAHSTTRLPILAPASPRA